jgi:very-short-patch-repair endonuclease
MLNKIMYNKDVIMKIFETTFKTEVVSEYKFCDTRKWRFDFCIPKYKIAIEVEGGVFERRTYKDKSGKLITVQGGRHNSVKGFLNDIEKYNAASLLGYTLFRFTPSNIVSAYALDMISMFIENKKADISTGLKPNPCQPINN